MFRGGNSVPAGCVHYDHAPPGSFRQVNIIDADTGASDDSELGCRVQHRGRDLRLTSHDDRTELGDDFHKRGFAQAGLGRDFERALARQFIRAALRNRISDQDFWSGHVQAL